MVEVEVPAILDKDEFDEVQEMLRERSPQLKAPRFVSGPTLLGGICFCADCGGAMTLRTSGKKADYRHYTCCTRARQGETGCAGRTVPMDRLDDLVVEQIEQRVLGGDRAASILAGLLERRRHDADDARDRIAQLKRQASDADARRGHGDYPEFCA